MRENFIKNFINAFLLGVKKVSVQNINLLKITFEKRTSYLNPLGKILKILRVIVVLKYHIIKIL